MIDTARVNSGTLFAIKHGEIPRKLNSFQFGLELARALVLPQIARRKGVIGLQKNIQKKIELCLNVLKKPEEEPPVDDSEAHQEVGHVDQELQHSGVNRFPSSSENKQRCKMCLESISGEGNKTKKNKLPKLARRCQTCDSALCSDHTFYTCKNCSQTFSVNIVETDDNPRYV